MKTIEIKTRHAIALLLCLIVFFGVQDALTLGRTAIITVVSLTDADTEYSHPLPSGTRGVQIVADGGTVRYAHSAGVLDGAPAVTDAYMELADGESDALLNLEINTTIYFAAPVGGTRVRIQTFSHYR